MLAETNLNEGLAWIRSSNRQRLQKQIKLGNMNIIDGVWKPEYVPFSGKKLDPDEIIVHKPDITIVYDYPLEGEFKFIYHTDDPTGFTRKDLSELIMKQYHQIYAEEESEVGNPGKGYNRAKCHGKYGIWGHGIDELILYDITENPDGTYSLGIGKIDS